MQKKKTIAGVFQDVGRITGNFLYRANPVAGVSSNYYKIPDPDYTDEVLSFTTGIYSTAKLFNNYFMSGVFFIHTGKLEIQ
jgi:hypothetical protein